MNNLQSRAIIAINNYNDFISKKKNLTYGDMINAFYQRLRSNYIVPKSLKIEYLRFRFKDDGTFIGLSIINNYKVSSEICSNIEMEVNSAIENLEYFDTYASPIEKKIFQLDTIVNSIKYYKICS